MTLKKGIQISKGSYSLDLILSNKTAPLLNLSCAFNIRLSVRSLFGNTDEFVSLNIIKSRSNGIKELKAIEGEKEEIE